jgi:hypothetical protein
LKDSKSPTFIWGCPFGDELSTVVSSVCRRVTKPDIAVKGVPVGFGTRDRVADEIADRAAYSLESQRVHLLHF